jgi:hypothetical protein
MNDRPTNAARSGLIVDALDRALEPKEADELTLLTDVLGDVSTWAQAPAELEDAVVRAVAAADPRAKKSRSLSAEVARQTKSRRRVVVPALAAAVVALTVVATVWLVRGGANADYQARLEATRSGSVASASAAVTRTDTGFRFIVDTHDLPKLRRGEYYQAWLKNQAGTLVPIGTFSSSDGRVTLWSGVSPADYSTMSVTVETTDNDQNSSGRRVLIGEVRATRSR